MAGGVASVRNTTDITPSGVHSVDNSCNALSRVTSHESRVMSDSDDDLDSGLPYGSHPVSLGRGTQELLECTANWNVSVFEPLKFVPAADVKEDLEKNGEKSDFHALAEELRTSQISELLFVFDEKASYGTDFIICTTQTAVAHFVSR